MTGDLPEASSDPGPRRQGRVSVPAPRFALPRAGARAAEAGATGLCRDQNARYVLCRLQAGEPAIGAPGAPPGDRDEPGINRGHWFAILYFKGMCDRCGGNGRVQLPVSPDVGERTRRSPVRPPRERSPASPNSHGAEPPSRHRRARSPDHSPPRSMSVPAPGPTCSDAPRNRGREEDRKERFPSPRVLAATSAPTELARRVR